MSAKLIFAAALLFAPLLSWARIGETPAQCKARYGEPFHIDNESGMILFRKPPMEVGCKFHEGVCVSIFLQHSEKDSLDNSTPLSDVEIKTLLAANSLGKTWRERKVISMNDEWETEDESLFAFRSLGDPMLIIVTAEEMKRQSDAKASEEKGSLKGF